MSEKAAALAEQFEQSNNDLITTVEQCSDVQWAAKCPDTGWSVAVQAHHIAGGEKGLAGFIGAVASGHTPPPITMEMINQGNARHAEEYVNVSKEETVALLRENGAAAAKMIRGLSDAQLARTGELIAGRAASVAQMIQSLSLGEIQRHGEHLRQAIAG